MSTLITGAIVMACAIIGLHFLRFWKSSRDTFFLYFALAFWIQGLQWLHSGTRTDLTEYSPLYYVARLVAYGLIVAAIVQKNVRRPGGEGDGGTD
jgi:hypothetical protein